MQTRPAIESNSMARRARTGVALALSLALHCGIAYAVMDAASVYGLSNVTTPSISVEVVQTIMLEATPTENAEPPPESAAQQASVAAPEPTPDKPIPETQIEKTEEPTAAEPTREAAYQPPPPPAPEAPTSRSRAPGRGHARTTGCRATPGDDRSARGHRSARSEARSRGGARRSRSARLRSGRRRKKRRNARPRWSNASASRTRKPSVRPNSSNVSARSSARRRSASRSAAKLRRKPPKSVKPRRPSSNANRRSRPKRQGKPRAPNAINARQLASRGKAKDTKGSGRTTASRGDILSYAALVRARVASNKPGGTGSGGTVVVSFGVSGGGGLTYARISRSSGQSGLDQAALAAVRRSGPFPPTPDQQTHTFSIPFHFN